MYTHGEDLIIQRAMQKAEREIMKVHSGGMMPQVKDIEVLQALCNYLGLQAMPTNHRYKDHPDPLWRHACIVTGVTVVQPSHVNLWGIDVYYTFCRGCGNLKWYRVQ